MNIWERKVQPNSRVEMEKTARNLENFMYYKKVKEKETINFHVEAFQVRKIVG